ncbi:hypothetical protein BGW36DRAFT_358639 [Talaromyces proteolyticus]|uniref:Developmental regulator FlbE n=1 Tax=Talaromyces proteolyticus TaxID=1131652 RepID=A0AAD4PXA7_9EURO|nr:uncharacterized protein BGW36DRAFT_358639 [Talaromyces proteolyticus]KAH8699132.1 hypothetical protein BGW36DRAFT_358639 [Talaromyces proteolyticus]
MPVYKVHGFQWPRGGIPSIRVFIVLENLDDAAAEYIQQKRTSELILGALKKNHPQATAHLPDLQLIEQYDPLDTSNAAVSQPYAFVADRVTVLPDHTRPRHGLSASIDQHQLDEMISPEARDSLIEIRDAIAPGEKIGWWMVYNGDPERYYPEIDEDNYMYDDESILSSETGHSSISEIPSEPRGGVESNTRAISRSGPPPVPSVPPESPKTNSPGLKKKRSFWKRRA